MERGLSLAYALSDSNEIRCQLVLLGRYSGFFLARGARRGAGRPFHDNETHTSVDRSIAINK